MSQVTFRRIHGRIVPIRTADRVESGVYTAAGGIAGLAAGRYASVLTHSAAIAENSARKIAAGKSYDLFGAAKVAKGLDKAKSLNKQAFGIKTFGYLTSGLLINAGLNKIVQGTRYENHPNKKKMIGSASAAGATFAVHQQLFHGVGNSFLKSTRMAFGLAKKKFG